MKKPWLFPVLAAATLSLSTVPALGEDRIDQDEAQALVERGEILSLEQLLARHSERLRGELLDLELEREQGRLIYEIEVLGDDGRVRELEFDARTGELTSTSGDD